MGCSIRKSRRSSNSQNDCDQPSDTWVEKGLVSCDSQHPHATKEMPGNTSGEPMKGTAVLENLANRPSLGEDNISETLLQQKEELHFQEKRIKESQAELKSEKKRQEEELHSQQQKLEHSWVELEDEKKRQEEEFNSQQQKLEQSWVELEAEKKRQEEEFYSQQRELEQSLVELEAEKSSQKKRLQTQEMQLDNQRAQLEADRKRFEKEKHEFNKLTSASRDSRKRNKDIRPGDITHEHLSTRFQEYFDTKHRIRLRKLKYTSKEARCDFLSRVLKVACKYCNDQVIKHLSEELSALQQPPQDPRNLNFDQPLLDEAQEKWRDRSAAFGLLLSVANIDPKERPEWIKKEEVQKLLSECECFRHALNSNPDVAEAVLESAIELAWIMSTLLPPSSACEPTVYYPEWQELVTTSDSTVNPETDTDYKLVYCRPILFFGAEGTIGKQGAVKCLLAEPVPLQTNGDGANNGEQPPSSRLDSSSNENRLEEPGSLHKLAETPHRESTALTPEAGGRILSSPSKATISHVSTTDEQNDTSVLTSPLDNEGSDGANGNLQATCKSTTEEVDKATRPMSDTGEQATNTTNPIEDNETEKNDKGYDQISTDYTPEKETIQPQLLGSAQNSDATQSSADDRFSSSTHKPNNSGTAADLPTADFGQQFDVTLNPQKLSPASLNIGGSQENLITAQQISDAISAVEQVMPFKIVLSQSQTNNPAVYEDGQLSDITDSKSTATKEILQLVRSVTVQPSAIQKKVPHSEFEKEN